MSRERHNQGESGQALVEAALTMPLMVFLLLGTIQLFAMLQARVMAEYASFQAVRSGALNHGDCRPMMHTAISAFLPTFTRTDTAANWQAAFNDKRKSDKYDVVDDGGNYNGAIVEMVRTSPGASATDEDFTFDQPGNAQTLSVRMVFWYEMRIPFANWVIARMMLASMGVAYTAQNPLIETQKANWGSTSAGMGAKTILQSEVWPGNDDLFQKFKNAVNNQHYVVPIEVGAAMRMMTPLKKVPAFTNCPNFMVAP